MAPRRSTPARDPQDDRIAVGVIRRAHGVRGEASVEPWTDDPDRLGSLGAVVVVSPDRSESRPSRVLAARPHGSRVLVMLEGIENPEAVRDIQNWTIEVAPDAARPLGPDEYYLHDLVGLSILDLWDRVLGRVTSVGEGGGGVLLEVQRPDGGTFDIPFVRAFIRKVDLDAAEIHVVLPEGLDDLDRAETVIEDAADSFVPVEPRRGAPALVIDVVTIFPAMFEAILGEGIIARAVREGILDIRVHDLRDYATDRHRSTDDEAYGGGAGMVMLAEPVFRCVESIAGGKPRPHSILLSPQGTVLTDAKARELARRERLLLLCGRYEGFDERVRLRLVDEEISLGDFVVTGGEIPAMLVIDAVGRMVDGVVGTRNSVEADSFFNGLLDHPHYTRPAVVRGDAVPEVLLSGHAEQIRRWRKMEAIRATLTKRPDLLARADLDNEAREMLDAIRRAKAEGEQSGPKNGSTGGQDD